MAKKVLLVFDMPQNPPSNQLEYLPLLNKPDWQDERDIYKTLAEDNRYEVQMCGLFDRIEPLLSMINTFKPQVVFPICESFSNNRIGAPHIVGLIELLGLRYTGARAKTLTLCRDKSLTKKVCNYHGIQTPNFDEFSKTPQKKQLSRFKFPVIIKPRDLEASEGLTKRSVANTPEACKAQIDKFVRQGIDVIVEEFIVGREIYIGIIGGSEPTILHPWELCFEKSAKPQTEFATYKVKWDEKYRKKWGIRTQAARGLNPAAKKSLVNFARKAATSLELSGYARLDLRMTSQGSIYFLEANPNPAINKKDDFASSAKKSGIGYSELLDKIIQLAG